MNIHNKLVWLVLISAIALAACGDDKNAAGKPPASTETALDHAEKHADPNYVCPMHPQIVRGKPGNCPICGMELIKKDSEQESADTAEKKILYWVAPMDASYRRDKPGKSPMGMDLVPVYDDGGGVSVKISPAVENNMGVRTAIVERGKLWRKIDTVGYVDFDENKISHIHIRTKGWVEKLVVQSEGERVKKGQLLFELYSPELVNAQDDYIQALKSGSQFLLNASMERLLALGISKQQIKEIKKLRRSNQFVRVYAPQDGIVAQLKVREGMYITPNMEVMSLADLSSIWILAEVFESQSNWVMQGQSADVKLSYVPGREWAGKVEYIYPSLNEKTRTLKVRLVFDNPDETLKPNMFANVSIYGGPKEDVLILPREALIRTGGDARVILADGKGRFRPREVVIGIESGDWIEIRQGLTEGDKVVTSGQFLIDSEASLKVSLQRMQSPAASGPKSMDKKTRATKGEMKSDMPAEQMAPQERDHSQHQMDTTETPIDMDNNEQASMQTKIGGSGIIREVLASEGKVKISHGPIPALKWPEMTMFFRVNPDIKLEAFQPEERVTFELQKGENGYAIKSMRKIAQ